MNMTELTAVEGVGPKTVASLYDALGVRTLDDLEDAAQAGEIREVSGFGATTEENILGGISFARQAQERELLGDARPAADDVLDFLEGVEDVERVDVAGSLRRWKPTIGDVDVLAASSDGAAVGEALADWERVEEVHDLGETKTSVRVDGKRVDLRVVVDGEFGAALQYFTGSKAHNVELRDDAIDQGLKVNEYGVFDVSEVEDAADAQRAGDLLASETEADVYEAVGLPWIPPELRENRGELDAAANGDLPDLLTVADVRGDLHTHSEWSDGALSVADLVAGAAEFGHDYLCVSDHAAGPGIVSDAGLSEADLREQADVVERVREDTDMTVFHGVEANVDADGGVGAVSDDALADLDLVVASPHSGLGDGGGDQTDRLVRAVEHPHVDVLGHPSGRLINQRPAMEFDPRELAEAAADAGTALEVNANPHRLDLWGSAVQAAVEAGATVVVNTDAHTTSEFRNIEYGVHTARRGWAEAGDVLNTRDAAGVRAFLDS